MPKTEPASLTLDEYGQVLAYLLKLNGMPEGEVDLPTDSVMLKGIRFDTAVAKGKIPNR